VALVAFLAVYWPVRVRYERHFCFLTAVSTFSFVHLSWSIVETTASAASAVKASSFHLFSSLFVLYQIHPKRAALGTSLFLGGLDGFVDWFNSWSDYI
jgi:hypothetical protein